MFALKHYQEQALEALATYVQQTRETSDPRTAFVLVTNEPYHAVPEVPGMPYVCLRVPTGGGKTVMACHAVGLVTHHLLQAEHTVTLWLVPTNQILDQTLAALRDPHHPYREALEQGLGSSAVTVLNLTEALSVPRSVLDGETVVIVSTLAALRVEDTEGRKVYDDNGYLMGHFEGLTPQQQAPLERTNGVGVVHSLANVLRLRRPLVIMDEAHNARTPLSFATLSRFQPSCVVEFTATPQRQHDPQRGVFASNVLHSVTAWQLKCEDMIKMPLRLETLPDWRHALGEALRQRQHLETLAQAEAQDTGEYLRPILLIQAQPHSSTRETLAVEVIEAALTQDFDIPAEQVRVATGQRREIADEDLLAPDCPVRVILTVQALREGWDCSFAYVLCSVAEMGAATAVEQILGRIMRLPGAQQKQHDELNSAYAYVASQRFHDAAQALHDGLVKNGFHTLEAQKTVQDLQEVMFEPGSLFADPASRAGSPAEAGIAFAVPRLTVRVSGQRELWEPEDYLPADWSLADCDPRLSEHEFRLRFGGTAHELAVTEDGLRLSYLQEVQVEQLALLPSESAFTLERLVNWLDRNIPHPDVPQAHSNVFLWHLVEHLTNARDLALADLTRERHRLRDAAAAKIAVHRLDARYVTYQLLLDDPSPVEAAPEFAFSYDPRHYPASWYYEGSYQFRKHYYYAVGELKPDGEEHGCAVLIDEAPAVRHWVRNLEKQPRHSFWLPTPTDRFYPDFVAELQDGRCLVVEYKGAHLADGRDTREKDALGRLWADRSDGRCLFFMATQDNLQELRDLLSSTTVS